MQEAGQHRPASAARLAPTNGPQRLCVSVSPRICLYRPEGCTRNPLFSCRLSWLPRSLLSSVASCLRSPVSPASRTTAHQRKKLDSIVQLRQPGWPRRAGPNGFAPPRHRGFALVGRMVACATSIRFCTVSIILRLVTGYQAVDAFGYRKLALNLPVAVAIPRHHNTGDDSPSTSHRFTDHDSPT